ncbi:MAG: TonB-dependent receptor [Bacteroidota bacterium]
MRLLFVLLLIFNPAAIVAQEYKGAISGRVIDSRTLEGIPNVHVTVRESSAFGATTDLNGAFTVKSLTVGTYSLTVSAVGFLPQVVTNVVTTTGRASPVLIKLEETAIEMEGVTTEARYFTRAEVMSPISANVFERSEILRLPGSIQDVQRVVQNLPGVASSNDNINELIVRGGASYENLTILDGMEIPSINHYANQFNSAGPINMVNADMIQDCQFSAGGYPVQFGDKSSSVMNLTVREGNREAGIASKTGFNMAGIGSLVEGGFGEGRGSYIFSARNSLLEFVDKLVGLSSISLTAVPKYWDTQAKVVYDLSPSNTLMLNILYGDSRINLAGDPTEKDDLRRNVIDSSSIEYLYPITRQHALGLNLRSLWGKKGYSNLILYTNGTETDVNVRSDFARRVRGPQGEVLDYRLLSSRTVFDNYGYESFLGAKFELVYELSPEHQISVGTQIQLSRRWKNNVFVAGDTLRYDLDHNGTYETEPVMVPTWSFNQNIGFARASKYYGYVSDTYTLSAGLALTAGLRYDHFTYSGAGALSPRGSLSYQITPGRTTLTFAAGRYYQTQPLPFYSDRRQLGYNTSLDDMRADHYVLGVSHILDVGLKGSIEAYYKRYSRVAVEESFVYSADPTFWSDRYLTVGRRTSYGVELFLEQKQVSSYYGTVSLSLSRSFMEDPRIPQVTSRFPAEYDYPVILTLVGGKVVKGIRDWLNGTPFFIRYPSYILPFSNEVELSMRYRFQTGRVYTPRQFVTWKQFREGGVKWSRGAWIDTDNINADRYPDYSRLDLQLISRFYFRTWNINVFLSVQNVMNTQNIFYRNYRSDGTVETIYQFAFFPVGGVEVEF